jgi:hypothetical protein
MARSAGRVAAVKRGRGRSAVVWTAVVLSFRGLVAAVVDVKRRGLDVCLAKGGEGASPATRCRPTGLQA